MPKKLWLNTGNAFLRTKKDILAPFELTDSVLTEKNIKSLKQTSTPIDCYALYLKESWNIADIIDRIHFLKNGLHFYARIHYRIDLCKAIKKYWSLAGLTIQQGLVQKNSNPKRNSPKFFVLQFESQLNHLLRPQFELETFFTIIWDDWVKAWSLKNFLQQYWGTLKNFLEVVIKFFFLGTSPTLRSNSPKKILLSPNNNEGM